MLSILRNVARSSSAPRTLSFPRLSASAAARPAALSPFYARSISWSGSGNSPAPSENPAAEAQADAATPDVKVEEAAKEAEVKEDPKIAELEAKVKEQTEKVADLTVRVFRCSIAPSDPSFEQLLFRTPDFAPCPTGNRLTTALFFFNSRAPYSSTEPPSVLCL